MRNFPYKDLKHYSRNSFGHGYKPAYNHHGEVGEQTYSIFGGTDPCNRSGKSSRTLRTVHRPQNDVSNLNVCFMNTNYNC